MNKAAWIRPQSLVEVARESTSQTDFNMFLSDFLDEFYSNSAYAKIEVEPAQMAGRFEKADVADVELAAVAESLAERLKLPCPAWAEKRSMPYPCFAYDDKELNDFLTQESPPPFRKRNLFVSENVLSRA